VKLAGEADAVLRHHSLNRSSKFNIGLPSDLKGQRVSTSNA
jgi:hypothetical protein